MSRTFTGALSALSAAVLLLSAAPAAICARESTDVSADPPLNLAQVIELARTHDRGLIIDRLAASIAGNQAAAARSALLPQVNVSAGKLWLKDPLEIHLPDIELDIVTPTELPMTLSAQIAIPLYQPGGYTTYRAARAAETAEWEAAMRREQTVVNDVTRLYYGILQGTRALAIADETISLLESVRDQARDYLEQGMVDKRDLLQAELRLAEMRQSRFSIERQTQLAVAALNRSIGRDIGAATEVADDTAIVPFALDLPAALAQADSLRPELRRMNAQLQAARLAMIASREKLLPSLYGVVSAQRIANEAIEPDTLIYGGFQLNFNLFDGGRTWAGMDEAANRHLQANLALDEYRQAIHLQVTDAWLAVAEQEQKLGVSATAIEQATENLRIVRDQYAEHMVTATEVLDAQTALTAAKNNYFRSVYQMKIARANLDWAMGATAITPATAEAR